MKKLLSVELNRLGLLTRTIRSSRKKNLGWLNYNFYRLFKCTNTQLFEQVSMLAKSETLLLICTLQKSRERSRSTHGNHCLLLKLILDLINSAFAPDGKSLVCRSCQFLDLLRPSIDKRRCFWEKNESS